MTVTKITTVFLAYGNPVQGSLHPVITSLRRQGIHVVLDWTARAFRARPVHDQRRAIRRAIEEADVFVLHMEEYRADAGGAGVLQSVIADAVGTPIMVFDPLHPPPPPPACAVEEGELSELSEVPRCIPDALQNVSGSFLADANVCIWVADHEKFIPAIRAWAACHDDAASDVDVPAA